MDIRIIKGERTDRIEARRSDGSSVGFDFQHKGPIPHDVVHLVVEDVLGITEGFWGLLARGMEPHAIGEMAKAAGHVSAKRALKPEPSIVPIVQAERIVEAFEADLWGGGSSNEAEREMIRGGCEQSLVPVPAISDEQIERVRAALSDFRDRWAGSAAGMAEQLSWAG
jgi:hypothetical protein